jgi:hypothetical protein
MNRVKGSQCRRIDRGRDGQGLPIEIDQSDPGKNLASPTLRGRPEASPAQRPGNFSKDQRARDTFGTFA